MPALQNNKWFISFIGQFQNLFQKEKKNNLYKPAKWRGNQSINQTYKVHAKVS